MRFSAVGSRRKRPGKRRRAMHRRFPERRIVRRTPGIGGKATSQIILDLKGHLASSDANPNQYDEVRTALKQLGFKVKDIDNVLSTINIPNATNEDILREALKRMKK